MIPATTFHGRRVALFGLGGSGVATARSLMQGGARVLAWDDNPQSVMAAAGEGIETGDLRQADWRALDALVLSPGVPLTHPKPHWTADLARGAGIPILGDIELFSRERTALAPDAPFIAITGTNGKSTTTALTAHILRSAGRSAQMGGNIGRAVLTLDPLRAEEHYVVECSSYQIDLAPSLRPSAGVLLNVTPDHLDRHGSMESYAAIKERLVAASETAIVGVDDAYGLAISGRLEAAGLAKVVRISAQAAVGEGYFADEAGDLYSASAGARSRVARLAGVGSLRGAHNAQNALAALAACRSVGLDYEQIQAGLETFPGLAHRMEQVARKDRVLFVNDSKATNADAAAPALSSFPRIYWIAGGLPKEGGIEPLRPWFPRIAKAYLIGEAAPAFSATLGEAVPYEIAGTLDAAVAHAAHDALRDDQGEAVVLLSPACASFDQYKNFEVRGEAFKAAVRAIPGTTPIGGSR